MTRRLSLLFAAGLATSGCFTYRAEPAPMPGPARVRVRFNPPRDLAVAVPGRDTLRIDNVTALEGHLLEVRGDTLSLAVRRAQVGVATVPGLAGADATTRVPVAAGRVVEVRELDSVRTALIIVGVAVSGALLLIIAAIGAVASVGY